MNKNIIKISKSKTYTVDRLRENDIINDVLEKFVNSLKKAGFEEYKKLYTHRMICIDNYKEFNYATFTYTRKKNRITEIRMNTILPYKFNVKDEIVFEIPRIKIKNLSKEKNVYFDDINSTIVHKLELILMNKFRIKEYSDRINRKYGESSNYVKLYNSKLRLYEIVKEFKDSDIGKFVEFMGSFPIIEIIDSINDEFICFNLSYRMGGYDKKKFNMIKSNYRSLYQIAKDDLSASMMYKKRFNDLDVFNCMKCEIVYTKDSQLLFKFSLKPKLKELLSQ